MTEKIRNYVLRRLHPMSGQMLMRHELQILFGQIMLRLIDSALPYYVVLAGPKGIGKSMVSNKILHSAQQHHRLCEVQTVIVRLSARHNDVKIAQTYIRQRLSRAHGEAFTGKQSPSDNNAYIHHTLKSTGLLIEIDDMDEFLVKPQLVLAKLVELSKLPGNRGVIILGIMPAYIQRSDLHVDLPYDLFEVPLMAHCNEWQAAQQHYKFMFLDMLQATHRDPTKEDPIALQAWNASVVAALESPKVTKQMASLACQGGLLPSMLATVCMWMMAGAESLVTEDLVMENLERISVEDQVKYVFERSKIEMIILIAMFRIGNGGRKAVHFHAMMREFNEVKDMVAPNGMLGALGPFHPNHVWGCFLSLLTAGVLKSRLSRPKEDAHVPPQYQTAYLMVDEVYLRQGTEQLFGRNALVLAKLPNMYCSRQQW
ncbi:hypothetical protein WJX77_010794 [Trebouxia sp. C0004]